MTKIRILATVLALGLPPLASSAAAQNYETFVIEVPYDISLPELFNALIIRCDIRGDEQTRSFSSTIQLQKGKAAGSIRIGYDRMRAREDLDWLPEANRLHLERVARTPGFALNVKCHIQEVFGPGRYAPTERDGSYVLLPSRGGATQKLPYNLVSTGADHGFDIEVTAADNTAPQSVESRTLTTTAPTKDTPGLSGLKSILEGN